MLIQERWQPGSAALSDASHGFLRAISVRFTKCLDPAAASTPRPLDDWRSALLAAAPACRLTLRLQVDHIEINPPPWKDVSWMIKEQRQEHQMTNGAGPPLALSGWGYAEFLAYLTRPRRSAPPTASTCRRSA